MPSVAVSLQCQVSLFHCNAKCQCFTAMPSVAVSLQCQVSLSLFHCNAKCRCFSVAVSAMPSVAVSLQCQVSRVAVSLQCQVSLFHCNAKCRCFTAMPSVNVSLQCQVSLFHCNAMCRCHFPRCVMYCCATFLAVSCIVVTPPAMLPIVITLQLRAADTPRRPVTSMTIIQQKHSPLITFSLISVVISPLISICCSGRTNACAAATLVSDTANATDTSH